MDYLAEVEERIKHKIEQIEEEMDNTHERADRLMPKIERLNWVLNEKYSYWTKRVKFLAAHIFRTTIF